FDSLCRVLGGVVFRGAFAGGGSLCCVVLDGSIRPVDDSNAGSSRGLDLRLPLRSRRRGGKLVDVFRREMSYGALLCLFVGHRHRLWKMSRCREWNGLSDIVVLLLLLLLSMHVDGLSIAIVGVESGIS